MAAALHAILGSLGATADMLVSKEVMAAILGLSPPSLAKWVDRGCPYESKPEKGALAKSSKGSANKADSGKQWVFSTEAVIHWVVAEELKKAVPAAPSISDDPVLRLQHAKADRAEVELARALGQYASIHDFRFALSGVVSSAKAKLRSLGSKLGRVVANEDDPGECARVIQAAVDEVLVELAGKRLEVTGDGKVRISGEEEEWIKAAREEGLEVEVADEVEVETAVEEEDGDAVAGDVFGDLERDLE